MRPALSSVLSRLLIDRAGGHRRLVLQGFRDRCRIDVWSAEERRCEQDRRLAVLLETSRVGVPRFANLLKGERGIDPQRARACLTSLPVMRKSAIQADPEAFINRSAGPSVDDFTGGSTGTPMRFRVDRATQLARESSLYWANSLAGWQPGQRVAMVWGSDRDTSAAAKNARLALRWWIDNIRWYNAFDMGEERMASFHDGMCRFRPHFIVAYAGSIFTYARFLRDRGIRPAYPLAGIVSSAEILTAPMRETVESVFHRPVFDRYGNREAGAIAAECPEHAGLHVNEMDFIVEIDSPDPYTEPGPLLVTYLANHAMPLIRYDTGDLAMFARGECRCGRTTLRIDRLVGRQSDTLRTSSGKLVHGEFFTHLLYGANGVKEFQFVQVSLTEYKLLVVCQERDPAQEARWKAKIRDAVGADASVRIEYVESIPVLTSGKRRFTLSMLPS